jgi:hypothetical protein
MFLESFIKSINIKRTEMIWKYAYNSIKRSKYTIFIRIQAHTYMQKGLICASTK